MGFATVAAAAIGAGASLAGASRQADAAKSATAAQTAATEKAISIARENKTANDALVNQHYGQSRQHLTQGFDRAEATLRPLVEQGERANDAYMTALGLGNRGEQGASDWERALLARHGNVEAIRQAQDQVAQTYASQGSGGSGAFGRALMRRQMAALGDIRNNELGHLRPLVASGQQARSGLAGLYTNRGDSLGSHAERMGNAFMSNNDNVTNAAAGGAVAIGKAQAAGAYASGNAWAQGTNGVANSFMGAASMYNSGQRSGNSFMSAGGNNWGPA